MSLSKPILANSFFALAVAFIAISYASSFQSGCRFDGKQGGGDLVVSELYSGIALVSFFCAILLLCAGLGFIKRWGPKQFIPALIIGIVVGLPICGVLSFQASVHGAQQCHPS
ncbi:MAG TPA: hypothetical protein VN023_07195 [Methylovorus sp.]|nr:hypothetical protein [Methylovorus sp.]